MLYNQFYYFTNTTLRHAFTVHSLHILFLSSFFFFDSSCLWILPWVFISHLFENAFTYLCHSTSHTLPKTNKNREKKLQCQSETHVEPPKATKRRRATSHSSLVLKRKMTRLCTQPEVASTTQPYDSDSGTDPGSPVTPDHDSRRYYSLFFTGFDLAPVVNCCTDEVEMIHENSVLNFLNQVDHEDNEFFSKHLDKNYAFES